MILYYSQSSKPMGNFGDELNVWIWERFLPGCWEGGEAEDDYHFSGIGTIIGNKMPEGKRWIVFGSGAGYRPAPPGFGDANWKVICVRGPLTAQAMDLPAETAVTDSAILLGALPEYQPLPESEREGVCFMPHHGVAGVGNWEAVCEKAGIEYLDPRADSRESLERIRRAKLVLADAMHAAITADTLRVPWIPMVTSPEINSFKWLDWCQSMGVPYCPVFLGPGSVAELPRYARFRLHSGFQIKRSDLSCPVEAFYRQCRRMRRPIYWRAKSGLAAMDKTLNHWSRVKPLSGIREYWEEKLSDQAAERLRFASQLDPFLSDDTIFRGKLDEMVGRLEKVNEIVGVSRV